MKKLLSALAVASASLGLLIAQNAYGASSVFSWEASDTTALTGQIVQVFTDFKLVLVLVIGISIGFVIIRKVMSSIKGGVK